MNYLSLWITEYIYIYIYYNNNNNIFQASFHFVCFELTITHMCSHLSRSFLYKNHLVPAGFHSPSPSNRIFSRQITCREMSCSSQTPSPTLRTVTISYSELKVSVLSRLCLALWENKLTKIMLLP